MLEFQTVLFSSAKFKENRPTVICPTRDVLITSCEKPKQAWDTLKKLFRARNSCEQAVLEEAVSTFWDERRNVGGAQAAET